MSMSDAACGSLSVDHCPFNDLQMEAPQSRTELNGLQVLMISDSSLDSY